MSDIPIWHILLPFTLWTVAIIAFFLIVKYGISRADKNKGYDSKDSFFGQESFDKERKEWEERKKRWGSE